jgi:hypothetical protein
MAISWTSKRQLILLFIVAVIFAIVAFFVFRAVTAPSCRDSKQNQGEEGIDCGAICGNQCLGEINDLIILWTKMFDLGEGQYGVAALVENPNLFLALSNLKYKFKLYDANNILIAIREGETFITPSKRQIIFEPTINAGERTPNKVFIEFDKNIQWEKVAEESLPLIVSSKQFTNDTFPRLTATIENKSLYPVDDIYVSTVLYDENNNALAVSVTKIDSISGGVSKSAIFTWPKPFAKLPSSSEIFLKRELQ